MIRKFLSLIILNSLLSACLPVIALTTAKVGTTIMEERSAGDVVEDAVIISKIKNEYAKKDLKQFFMKISVDSTEGRVLLTGSVPDHAHMVHAVEVAWGVKGVKEVINELEVSNKSFKESMKDGAIMAHIKARLLMEKDVRSVNYTVDVNKGTAYLIGIARDKTELDKALEVARTTKGVKKVVSHVALKSDPRRQRDE